MHSEMYQLNRDDLSLSAEVFLTQTGHNIIELFNKVLTNKADLTKLVEENNVEVISPDLPGLIVQAYLVLVKLFDLNVMEPIISAKVEELTPPNSCDYVNYEEESGVDSDDDFKVEAIEDSDDEFVPFGFEDYEPPQKRQKSLQNSRSKSNVGFKKTGLNKVSTKWKGKGEKRVPDGCSYRYIGRRFTKGQVSDFNFFSETIFM